MERAELDQNANNQAIADAWVLLGTIGAGGRAKVLWDGAPKFERHHPLVNQIATAIGKTQADLDDLFIKSATYGPH